MLSLSPLHHKPAASQGFDPKCDAIFNKEIIDSKAEFATEARKAKQRDNKATEDRH